MSLYPLLSRRGLLRFSSRAALALPLYRVLRETDALGAIGVAQNALFIYYPDGNIAPQFFPQALGTGYSLPAISSPLAAHSADISFIRGLNFQTTGSHEGGAAYCLTGNNAAAGGYSIDNYVADQLGQGSPVPALRLGVGATFQAGQNDSVSFLKSGALAFVQDDPLLAFQSVFGTGGATGQARVDLNQGKRSVLDFALGELQGLQTQLGATEKAKLDNHLTAVRDLERRMSAVSQVTCANPALNNHGLTLPANDSQYPKTVDVNDNYGTIGLIMMDLMVQALACGMTRFGLLQWSHAVSPTHFNFAGGPGIDVGQHDLSHFGGDPSVDYGIKFAACQKYHMQQIAYLLTALKGVNVAGGTLLDTTVVMATTELGDSNLHNYVDIACLIAGNNGGRLKQGQSLQSSTNFYNQLLVTVLQALGLSDTTFGNASLGPAGPVAGLLA